MSNTNENNLTMLTTALSNLNETAAKLNVMDKDGKIIDFEKIAIELQSKTGDTKEFVTLQSVSELRALEPNTHGEIAVVLSYDKGTGYGGGIFTYNLNDNVNVEDFGVTIVTPKGARWVRHVAHPSVISVVDFGEIGRAHV